MNTTTLINGRATDTLDASDRGLAYGDGLFETMAVRDGGVPLLGLHFDRLREGCARLDLPFTDWAALETEIGNLAREQWRAVIKAVVTRGPGGRGYRVPDAPQCTRIVSRHAWPDWPGEWKHQGIAVRLCETRLARNPRLAGLKHLNRLEQVLARAEWRDPGIVEGLMLDTEGALIEGVMTNLFFVTENTLCTPALDHAGVAGVMRRRILEAAPGLDIPCRIRPDSADGLWRAEEVFVCNSTAGIWPVTRCGDRRWPVGTITRRLMDALESETA